MILFSKINIVKILIVYITKNSLNIQCHIMKILMAFYRTRKKTLKFVWKPKRPQIAKEIPSSMNIAGNIILPEPDNITEPSWQRQKDIGTYQTKRPMKHNIRSEGKPRQEWTPGVWQRLEKPALEKRQPSQLKVLAKLDTHLWKNKIRYIYLFPTQNQFKFDLRS